MNRVPTWIECCAPFIGLSLATMTSMNSIMTLTNRITGQETIEDSLHRRNIVLLSLTSSAAIGTITYMAMRLIHQRRQAD